MTTDPASARLDKWLMVARVFKTRSQASRACSLGRVRVNGYRAKAHRALSVEDKVEVERRDWTQVFVVRKIASHPVRKAEARELYEDQSPPRPTVDPLARLLRKAPFERERGAGRPTKRDRRKLDRARRGPKEAP